MVIVPSSFHCLSREDSSRMKMALSIIFEKLETGTKRMLSRSLFRYYIHIFLSKKRQLDLFFIDFM